MHKLLILFLSLISLNAFANICDQANLLDKLAVQSHGRVKSYLVASKEFLKTITDKSSHDKYTASEIFCLLSLNSLKSPESIDLSVKIEHIDTKKLLNMPENAHERSVSSLVGSKDMIRAEIMRQKQSTSYKKSLNKLWYKIDQYEKALNGEFWTTPVVTNQEAIWTSAATFLTLEDLESSGLEKLITNNKSFNELGSNSVSLEYKFSKSHIFDFAMLFAIIGIFFTVLIKKTNFGQSLAWIVILTEATGIAMRVMISGRAPITNMYETVLFSGFGALFISLIIFQFKKDKIFILGGLAYNILCLFMMKFANGMLDEAISPLVPVLRDNFWLSTHVTTIILSYAALALSWMLANMTLIKQRFGTLTMKDYRYYEGLIYTAIKVGIVMLAAGIILGGVWADYSWGRFWGWDPKETWSLIVLLFYMAVLHGKNTTWINTHRFIMLAAGGFMTVMMAWFGVNYIVASGLHSYGFSEGGAIFLGSFFILQTIVIIITGFNKVQKTKHA